MEETPMKPSAPMPSGSSSDTDMHGLLMILNIIVVVLIILGGVYIWNRETTKQQIFTGMKADLIVLDEKVNVIHEDGMAVKEMLMEMREAMMQAQEQMDQQEMMMQRDELNFVHPLFGYALTFPEAWRGYTITYPTLEGVERLDVTQFGFEQDNHIFEIHVETIESRDAFLASEPDGAIGVELGRDDTFVYLVGGASDGTDIDELQDEAAMTSQILTTFRPKQ